MKKAPGAAHYQLGHSLLRQHLWEELIAHRILQYSARSNGPLHLSTFRSLLCSLERHLPHFFTLKSNRS